MDILIPVTPIELGRFAIVGIEDFDLANEKWFTYKNSLYARRSDKTKAFMHRTIYERVINRSLEKIEFIDHIDGDGLNNKRSNLRIATSHQNHLNQHGRGTSQFRGVSYDNDTGKWAVQIHYDDLSSHLGLYNDEIIAAQVYDAAARQFLDINFVKLNFPNQIFNLADFDISIDTQTNRPRVKSRLSQVGYRGVEFISNRYRARISVNGKNIHLGLYKTPLEAAIVYNKAVNTYRK